MNTACAEVETKTVDDDVQVVSEVVAIQQREQIDASLLSLQFTTLKPRQRHVSLQLLKGGFTVNLLLLGVSVRIFCNISQHMLRKVAEDAFGFGDALTSKPFQHGLKRWMLEVVVREQAVTDVNVFAFGLVDAATLLVNTTGHVLFKTHDEVVFTDLGVVVVEKILLVLVGEDVTKLNL